MDKPTRAGISPQSLGLAPVHTSVRSVRMELE